jgi:hypothetical protein
VPSVCNSIVLNVVIWIFEEKAFCSFARTQVTGYAQNHEQSHFPHRAHRAPNAVAGSLGGNELSHRADVAAGVAAHWTAADCAFGNVRSRKLIVCLLFCRARAALATGSAMIRAQRSA